MIKVAFTTVEFLAHRSLLGCTCRDLHHHLRFEALRAFDNGEGRVYFGVPWDVVPLTDDSLESTDPVLRDEAGTWWIAHVRRIEETLDGRMLLAVVDMESLGNLGEW